MQTLKVQELFFTIVSLWSWCQKTTGLKGHVCALRCYITIGALGSILFFHRPLVVNMIMKFFCWQPVDCEKQTGSTNTVTLCRNTSLNDTIHLSESAALPSPQCWVNQFWSCSKALSSTMWGGEEKCSNKCVQSCSLYD